MVWFLYSTLLESVTLIILLTLNISIFVLCDLSVSCENAKTYLHLARLFEGRPPPCVFILTWLLFTEANKDRTGFLLLNVRAVLKNQDLISSPVRLRCSRALICMNMYKHLFLTFKGLTAKPGTCFRTAAGQVFWAQLGENYLSSLLLWAGEANVYVYLM